MSPEQGISTASGVQTSFWDFFSLVSSNIVRIPLSLISSSLMARILGPAGYGYIALFTIVTGILDLLISNWTLSAVLRFGREEYNTSGRLNQTFWARNLLALPCMAVGFALIYLWRDAITTYVGTPPWTIWLIFAIVFTQNIRGYVDYLLQATRQLKLYAAGQALTSVCVILGLLIIWFGPAQKSYLAVLISSMVAALVVLTTLLVFLRPNKFLTPVHTNLDMVRNIFYFSYPIVFGNVAAYVVQWVDTLVIKHYFALADVGAYQIAYNAFNLLTGWVGTINVLMAPMLISFVAASRHDLVKRYSTRLAPQVLLLWTAAIGVGMGFVPAAFQLLYGNEFQISATYFQFLIFGLVVSGFSYFYSGVITAYKLIKASMIASVARAIVNLSGDLLLVPLLGPAGAAWANTLGIAVAGILYLIICQRQLQIKLMWQLALLLPALLALGICRLVTAPWLALALSVLATLATSYYLAQRFQLFRTEDVDFLERVQMPAKARTLLIGLYRLLETKPLSRSYGVNS